MGRFLAILLGGLTVIAAAVLLIVNGSGRGSIQFGSIETELDTTAAVVRDEKVVMTEPYEKISFNVIEGQTVNNGDLIAQVYKRGYQDETMISLLNLQKQIYAYQMQLLGGSQPQELLDMNNNILTVEGQIRSAVRGASDLDVLTLEQSLKGLQTERINLLASLLTADSSLNGMYADLRNQQATQDTWKRDIKNESGTGVVSFYFDGYERVLCVDKLSTVNAALVTSVVKGGNTANTTESSSETPLYRLVNNTNWYLMYVTKSSEPMRLVAGETYTVSFPDFSDQEYTATAQSATPSEQNVLNTLAFNMDLGKLSGVRTVAIHIKKSAQGLMVPLSVIDTTMSVPAINVSYGDTALRVEIEVLASDDKKAVIRARNEQDTLTAGQKYIKP